MFFISCFFIVSLSFMDGFLVERWKDSNSNGWEEIYSWVNLCQMLILISEFVFQEKEFILRSQFSKAGI